MELIKKTSPSMVSIVQAYIEKDIVLRWDMEDVEVGCADWCMLDMRCLLLVQTCKDELRATVPKPQTTCPTCNVPTYFDSVTSDYVCRKCGGCMYLLVNAANHGVKERRSYNRNPVHNYTSSEHFAQTLSDFADIGARVIPPEILTYCHTVLGNGVHITSAQVFELLQCHGYRAYYQHKYAIANTLRQKREFQLSGDEIRLMRICYRRYKNEFAVFQIQCNIGTTSKKGKVRIYWPMRFVLARICEEIERADLVQYIRGISCVKRLDKYYKYWIMLELVVLHRYGKLVTRQRHLPQLVQLKKSRQSR